MLTLESPLLQRFYADWDSRRRGREFPARRDFDPCDLKYALGDISLLDVLTDPLRFRFRVHGTSIAERIGVELTGKFVDQMPDRRQSAMALAHFTEVVDRRAPVAKIRHAYTTDRQVWNCEVVVLPLSSNGIDIDMLISCIAWDPAPSPARSSLVAGAAVAHRE